MRVCKRDICVYSCDRCGKNLAFEERLETSRQKSMPCIFTVNEKILCEDCAKSFIKWFSECEKEPRG